ncbi:hypothetical protein ACFTXM_15050 [Streptomyces sp. NPDC056930]|uniref:hypothetical protein n=1 Tax=Streptomyces sp. NPDC056930 TaxID=3345967 RepID=UPI00363C51CE
MEGERGLERGTQCLPGAGIDGLVADGFRQEGDEPLLAAGDEVFLQERPDLLATAEFVVGSPMRRVRPRALMQELYRNSVDRQFIEPVRDAVR